MGTIGCASRNTLRSLRLTSTRRPTFWARNCLLRIAKRIVDAPSPEVSAACFTVKNALSSVAPCSVRPPALANASCTASLIMGFRIAARASARELFGSFIFTSTSRTPNTPTRVSRRCPLSASSSRRKLRKQATLAPVIAPLSGLGGCLGLIWFRNPVRFAIRP